MASQANFAATPRSSSARLTVANASVDGSAGTVVTIFTAGANGSRIDSVQIKGVVAEGATQAADTVRLFIWDTNTNRAFKEVLVPAGGAVVSVTQANFEQTVALGISLPANFQLRGAPHTGGATGSYDATALGGDY